MIYTKLKKFLQSFGGFAEWYTFQCESDIELEIIDSIEVLVPNS